jgi:hypothetical protein
MSPLDDSRAHVPDNSGRCCAALAPSAAAPNTSTAVTYRFISLSLLVSSRSAGKDTGPARKLGGNRLAKS